MKKLITTAFVLAATLALVQPASAAPLQAGNLVAGSLSENVTVAGDAVLLDARNPPDLPFGTDVSLAGNPIPPNVYAEGTNLPLDANQALAAVGPEANDVVAANEFIGGDFTQAGIGNLSADTEGALD